MEAISRRRSHTLHAPINGGCSGGDREQSETENGECRRIEEEEDKPSLPSRMASPRHCDFTLIHQQESKGTSEADRQQEDDTLGDPESGLEADGSSEVGDWQGVRLESGQDEA